MSETPKLATAAQITALKSIGAAAFGRASRDANLLNAAQNQSFAVSSLSELTTLQASQLMGAIKREFNLP